MMTLKEQLDPIRSLIKPSRTTKRKRLRRASCRTKKEHNTKHRYVGYDWSLG